MYLGYNTNGLSHHDLFDAIEMLANIGYRGVAITIDHDALSPRDENSWETLLRLRDLMQQRRMRSVIETGARFLLDPRQKHEPTLVSPDNSCRIEFYKYAIDCAAALKSDCVSLWSGALRRPDAMTPHWQVHKKSDQESIASIESDTSDLYREAIDRLVKGLHETLDYAAQRKVAIGFEPEPDMLIDSMQAFEEIFPRIDSPNLGVTLDIGHLHCQGETPITSVIRHWGSRLVNVHLEDMRVGVHEHLMFGEGEIEFPPILHALKETGYTGGVFVELSRHSHEGPTAAQQAFDFLQPLFR
jgi:sugar phosphate isomerase/epimerase